MTQLPIKQEILHVMGIANQICIWNRDWSKTLQSDGEKAFNWFHILEFNSHMASNFAGCGILQI